MASTIDARTQRRDASGASDNRNERPVTVPIAQRVPNTKLRELRLSLHMSQNDLATAVRHTGEAMGNPNACNKRLIQKWESGEHPTCRPNYRRALERVTRKPYADLGFSDSDRQPAIASVSDLLHQADVFPDPDSTGTGEPSGALRYALTRPEVASAATVDLITKTTAHLFGLEQHHPSSLMLPIVARHVSDIAALVAGTRHKRLRHRLIIAGGQSAALAGWLAFDLDDITTAHRYWDSAMAAAGRTGDDLLFACVLIHLSYSAAHRGDPYTAWQLAHSAISHADGDDRAQAWAAVRSAQEAAQYGATSAALIDLQLALDLATNVHRTAPDGASQPWSLFVDRAYVWAMAARVYGRLDDTSNARVYAFQAVDYLSANVTKTRAIVLAEAGSALSSGSEENHGTRYVIEAEAIARELNQRISGMY